MKRSSSKSTAIFRTRTLQRMKQSIVNLVKQRRPTRDAPPLLPPLKLYKQILRAHYQKLPLPQRSLGDQYVKAEFKAHKSIDNPLHIVGFLTSWQEYLQMIDGGDWLNTSLKREDLDKMSPEQIGQLYELMNETKNFKLDS